MGDIEELASTSQLGAFLRFCVYSSFLVVLGTSLCFLWIPLDELIGIDFDLQKRFFGLMIKNRGHHS